MSYSGNLFFFFFLILMPFALLVGTSGHLDFATFGFASSAYNDVVNC